MGRHIPGYQYTSKLNALTDQPWQLGGRYSHWKKGMDWITKFGRVLEVVRNAIE